MARSSWWTVIAAVMACSTPRDVAVTQPDGGAGRDAAMEVPRAGAGGGGNGGIPVVVPDAGAAGAAGALAGMAAGAAGGPVAGAGGAQGGAGGSGGVPSDGTGVVSISYENGSISPEPGETKVTIKFAQPVDRAATVASYVSPNLARALLRFDWVDDQTLEISAVSTLPYETGNDAAVVAMRFQCTITVHTAAGMTLLPRTWRMSTWRYVKALPLPYAPAWSGRIAGTTFATDARLTVGGADRHRSFVTFDLMGAPEVKRVTSVEVQLHQSGVTGTPYTMNTPDFTNGARATRGQWATWSAADAMSNYDAMIFMEAGSLMPQTAALERKSARIDETAPVLLNPAAHNRRAQFRVEMNPSGATMGVIEFATTGAMAPRLVMSGFII